MGEAEQKEMFRQIYDQMGGEEEERGADPEKNFADALRQADEAKVKLDAAAACEGPLPVKEVKQENHDNQEDQGEQEEPAGEVKNEFWSSAVLEQFSSGSPKPDEKKEVLWSPELGRPHPGRSLGQYKWCADGVSHLGRWNPKAWQDINVTEYGEADQLRRVMVKDIDKKKTSEQKIRDYFLGTFPQAEIEHIQVNNTFMKHLKYLVYLI